MPKLTCKMVRFYSLTDEWAFFQFALHIPAVQRLEGEGDALFVHVRPKPSEQDLYDLIGLFSRYKIGGMSQLAVFRTAANEAWFADPKMYWHEKVFQEKALKAPRRAPPGSSRKSAPP